MAEKNEHFSNCGQCNGLKITKKMSVKRFRRNRKSLIFSILLKSMHLRFSLEIDKRIILHVTILFLIATPAFFMFWGHSRLIEVYMFNFNTAEAQYRFGLLTTVMLFFLDESTARTFER